MSFTEQIKNKKSTFNNMNVQKSLVTTCLGHGGLNWATRFHFMKYLNQSNKFK